MPAVVIAGLLGSGKTTLVRALLADAQRAGIRAAVITNEFGELGIDRALLGPLGDGSVELAGGCICCRLSDELVETLQQLWERERPERILIETSGVALPYDVQLDFGREPVSLWAEDAIAAVVVDAEQLRDGRDLDATFEQQVSSADYLILNKIDRVDPRDLPALEARLRAIEPDAPVIHSIRGDVDPALLFPPEFRPARNRSQAPAHSHAHFTHEVATFPPDVDPAELRRSLQASGALRIKGFVQTSAGLRLVQGVGPRIEITAAGETPPPELIGHVVLITRS